VTGSGPSLATDFQRTIKDDIKLAGPGLHTGEACEVVIGSAEADSGIVLVRNGVEIPVAVGNVVDTTRGSSIGAGGESVMTVEHLMAALRGCGVDNARVAVTGAEIPALDGSSIPFVDAIMAVGTESQGSRRCGYTISEPVRVQNENGYILATPADAFRVNYIMRYDHPMIGAQSFEFTFDEEGFREKIAPARTFVLYEEVAQLISQRLAQGGSLSNTIVVWQDHLSCDLRFPDELARHKILDVIGDLALLGGTLRAEIVAVRSGHSLNVELAKKVSEIGVRDKWEGSA
jgi:UDP-3-O-acyl N-acetylglucosamine deacetylase